MSRRRYNLGCGGQPLGGYTNLDRKHGHECYPLAMDDNQADEIRASHLLEHFPHREVGEVLKDWVRALKPGGILKIAVPDFARIAELYLAGQDLPVQGYTMGGQVDDDDYHKTLFDAESLTEAMRAAGLIGISSWQDKAGDCAGLPISLNLMGIKPGDFSIGKVGAVMSVPRLGFMDNFFCATQALLPYKISLRKHSGAFWGQCLTRACEQAMADGCDWLLAIDYDTVFTKEHIAQLLSLAARYPEADAIAPVQASRSRQYPLMTIKGEDGKNRAQVAIDEFAGELTAVSTAHFGLTMIRVKSLSSLPKPWFLGVPDSDGAWGDGRVDDDIWFWRQWEKAGHTLYLANRVVVGHLELMIRWPDRQFKTIHQHSSDFWQQGAPENIWR